MCHRPVTGWPVTGIGVQLIDSVMVIPAVTGVTSVTGEIPADFGR